MAFHEVLFPSDISRGSSGGPRRLTDVVTLRSGFEFRNSLWANSRRSYNAGLGLRHMDHLYQAIEFFEARRGRLHGFRWKDWSDYKSGSPTSTITNADQQIGTGNGVITVFQLTKLYSSSSSPYTREIKKPVAGSLTVAVNGVAQTIATDFTVNTTTGLVTFAVAPGNGLPVTAGFEFDVPVRFDQDEILVNVELFDSGQVPDLSIMEIRI